MPSFEHNQLIKEIRRIDELPAQPERFADWIKAGAHLDFLERNARANEVLIYGSGEYTFVHSVILPNAVLSTLGEKELLGWSGTPYTSIASYVYGGGRPDVWVERSTDDRSSMDLRGAMQLVFARTFEGWAGPEATCLELNQEFTHLAGIHWRPQHRAYCRYDDNGDLEYTASITARTEKVSDVACVSFLWQPLELYLATTDSVLLRRFDFTLLRRESFGAWPDGPEAVLRKGSDFVCRQKVLEGSAAYTTGFQIVRPRRSYEEIFAEFRGDRPKQYASFIAQDWRNRRVTEISTDPTATTNYFEAKKNRLPFELSPAYFRPEVILKYKADQEKYTVGERDITCRNAWHLEAVDVNGAGQVFAYICYLRRLPYNEQLHWKGYNEPPKTGISERALTNDFKGEFVLFQEPVSEVLTIARGWHDSKASWWTLRDSRLLDRVATPLTTSRDEWAEAFLNLSKLIVEGFEVGAIRARLTELGVSFDGKEQSIALLERLLYRDFAGERPKLTALRTVQFVRTKAKGHVSGHEVEALVHDVIAEHGTFANHFTSVCRALAVELQRVAGAFSDSPIAPAQSKDLDE